MYSDVIYNKMQNSWKVTKVNGSYCTMGPLNVCLQITRRCNLRCVYCCEPDLSIKDLDIKKIELILSLISKVGTKLIKITGGEPLLHKDFEKIIMLVKQYGMISAVDTNATLISSVNVKKMVDKLAYVSVSIDGPQNLHDKTRGEFIKMIRGISLIHQNKIPLILNMVFTDQTLTDLEYVLSIADRFNALILRIVPVMEKGNGSQYQSKNLSLIVDLIKEIKSKNNFRTKVILFNWEDVGTGSVIIIQPDGLMIGTPSSDSKTNIIEIGNIIEQPVYDVWNSYRYKNNHIMKCIEKTVHVL